MLANLDLLLEIILDLPFGFPINNIISSLSRGGGLGSSTFFKKLNETYAPS